MSSKHKHAEAFHLMQYQDEITGEIEWLWNSRDGVTPFMITSRRGNTAQHIAWSEDKYLPNYVPKSGERIFVDATEQLVQTELQAYIDRHWDNLDCPMREMFGSKNAAYSDLLPDWIGDDQSGPQPFVLTVT